MKMPQKAFVILVLILTSCRSISEKKLITENKTESILFRGVNIFNGKDSLLITDKDVLVQNGIIKIISNSIKDTTNRLVINAKGQTLMPGLIDAHVHLSGSGAVPWDNYSANEEYNLSAYLYAGITTVYDLGGIAKSISGLAKKVDENQLIGPSIYNTHIPITVKNSHPIPLTKLMLPFPLKGLVSIISPTIDKIEEAPKLLEKYISNDIDYVKIICDQIPPGSPEMSFEKMKALINEAHTHSKKVFVHIGSPENAVNAVKAGADVLAHGIWRGQLTPEQANIIADAQIPIIYTVAGFHNISQINQGKFEPNELDKFLVDDAIIKPVTGVKGKDVHDQEIMNAFFNNAYENSQYWKHNFKLLHDRNAPIVIGTDSNLPGTYSGSTYFQEIDLLKEYGLSNFEILRAATFLNSTLFLEEPNFGTVEINKKADLLLINGNPLSDLDLLKTPQLIIKNGNIINRI